MYSPRILPLNEYIVIILRGYMATFQAASLKQLIIRIFLNLSFAQVGEN